MKLRCLKTYKTVEVGQWTQIFLCEECYKLVRFKKIIGTLHWCRFEKDRRTVP